MPTESASSGVFVNVPKPDNAALARANLVATQSSLQRQLDAVTRAIENLDDAMNQSGGQTIGAPPPRPHEYDGLRAIDALENYLRSRPGIKLPLAQAVEHVLKGGALWGSPRGRSSDPVRRAIHNIKIALPNRTKTFSWEPTTITAKGWKAAPKGDVPIMIWLAESATTPMKRKRAK